MAINGTFLVKPITGVQRYAYEMINALAKFGIEDVVILAPGNAAHLELSGYKVIRDSIQSSIFQYPAFWEQTRLPKMYDVLSGYVLWSPANTGPIVINNQYLTIHDTAFLTNRKWFSTFGGLYYKFLISALAKRVKGIFTVSEFSKSEIQKYLSPTTDIFVVPCGVSNLFRSPQLEFDFNQCFGTKKYVMFLGSRDPRKNINALIAAWRMTEDWVRREYDLYIVGGGYRGCNDHVFSNERTIKILGYCSDEEIKYLYTNAELFVFPSLYEGFGLPPLEAMACGTAVLVSNRASLPEVCDDGAYYCNPDDPQDIAAKIAFILENDDLRMKLKKKGIQQARRYTWENSANCLVQAFDT